jgi:hypothetical protein
MITIHNTEIGEARPVVTTKDQHTPHFRLWAVNRHKQVIQPHKITKLRVDWGGQGCNGSRHKTRPLFGIL